MVYHVANSFDTIYFEKVYTHQFFSSILNYHMMNFLRLFIIIDACSP